MSGTKSARTITKTKIYSFKNACHKLLCIFLKCDINKTKINMSPKMRRFLYIQGVESTEKYLKKKRF